MLLPVLRSRISSLNRSASAESSLTSSLPTFSHIRPRVTPASYNVRGHERILRVRRITWGVAVQQLPFLVVERTQPMQGLAEVDREVLTLAAAARLLSVCSLTIPP